MRREALLLIAAGCNQIYGLDPTTVRDLEPPACATVQFGAPAELAQFRGGDRELDPQLSSDGTELWYVSNTTGTDKRYLLHRGVRPSTDVPFVTTLVELVDNDINQGDPAMTADGRRLMWRLAGSDSALYEAIRDDPRAFPFDSVVVVSGFADTEGIDSFDLTWDGLRIYYTIDGVIWAARRETRDSPFIDHRMIVDAKATFLTISGDELETFYTRDGEPGEEHAMYRRARPDVDSPFGPEMLVLDEGTDPDIAPSSSVLIVARLGGLSILNRRCD